MQSTLETAEWLDSNIFTRLEHFCPLLPVCCVECAAQGEACRVGVCALAFLGVYLEVCFLYGGETSIKAFCQSTCPM